MIASTGLNVAGLRSTFFARLAAITNVYWQLLSMQVQTSKGNEDFRWLGAVPQMREWGSGRIGKGLNVESYNIATKRYESTLEVDRLEVDRDQTAQIKIRINELAERAATHKDFLIGNLIKNGASAGYTVQDGKTFFATDHQYGDSGVQSNDLTFDISAKLPAEPDTPTTPSAPTIRRAFSEMVGAMAAYKDDRGEPLRMSPSGLAIACTPLTAQAYFDGLNATMINNTSVQPVIGKPVQIIAFPELTNHAQFYAFKTDDSVKPFTLLDESPIEFNAQENNSESGFMQEIYRYGVRAVYAMWFGDWKKAIRMTLT